jgi:hypothetical protein
LKEFIGKFLPQNFNDFLCLILIFGIVTLWILQGCQKVTLEPQVTGALIVTWTLVVQFYFRKTPTLPNTATTTTNTNTDTASPEK